ncbi:type VI secretion system-associated FHA domain protein TagH [Tropicimonas sp.]|uniref:type VI secretion system-associated FHA domain protein TagH n=1 Tax=Tropicimonas sp. TaxID=2067044 RepID=UPI003A8511C6
MTVVIRFQSTGVVPGEGRPVPMVGNALTIGRANDNDLVLPDPDRIVSSHHCAIEDQNGNVVVIDLSTNGTFLNYGKVPLGRVPTPLNDGDILCIGGYELVVDLSARMRKDPLADLPPPAETGALGPGSARADDDLASLLDDPGPGGRDFLDELLGEPAAPVGPRGVRRPEPGDDGLLPPLGEGEDDPLAPAADPDSGLGASQPFDSPSMHDHMPLPRAVPQAIPDDWDLDFPADGPVPGPAAIPDEGSAPHMSGAAFIPDNEDPGFRAPKTDTVPARRGVARPQPDAGADELPATPPATGSPDNPTAGPARRATGSGRNAASDAAALGVFFKAAGVADIDLTDVETDPTMARLGNVLRIMIHGLRDILMTRTSIKSEFRIDQTRISASGNNPLKFSVTPEQAVEVMMKPPMRGYLEAEAAAEQALRDIKAHEIAMMTGMEAALKGVLKKLAPDQLEGRITSAGGLGGLLKGKKARYWETYEKIYADVADQAENDFHDLFSREFARAYQAQLEKLKDAK